MTEIERTKFDTLTMVNCFRAVLRCGSVHSTHRRSGGGASTYSEARITFELCGHGRTADGDSNDDDDHRYECDGTCFAKFFDVTVERQWIGYCQGKECDNELSIGEEASG